MPIGSIPSYYLSRLMHQAQADYLRAKLSPDTMHAFNKGPLDIGGSAKRGPSPKTPIRLRHPVLDETTPKKTAFLKRLSMAALGAASYMAPAVAGDYAYHATSSLPAPLNLLIGGALAASFIMNAATLMVDNKNMLAWISSLAMVVLCGVPDPCVLPAFVVATATAGFEIARKKQHQDIQGPKNY